MRIPKMTNLDFASIKTPCYLIDTDRLSQNFQQVKAQTDKANLSLLMAMKGFPLVKAFPYISPFICGTSASGLFEAKLGSPLGKENHIHTPAYKAEDAQEILSVCDHIVLNSPGQAEIFSQLATSKNEFGLRLNPEISAVKEEVYNPCAPFSRFGVKKTDMDEIDSKIMNKISGFHVHALCGNSGKDFNSLLSATIEKFSPYFHDISWINLGGGQALTEDDFDFSFFQKNLDILQNKYHLKTYIEPCEYLVMDAGFLITTVLDIVHNKKDIAILDTSISCHALDVLKNYYKLPVVFPQTCESHHLSKHSYILAGNSCLSGDLFGTYEFEEPLKPGDKIVFGDMGSYSFAQQNYFNGINFPSIAFYNKTDGLRQIKNYTYKNYEEIYD